MWSPETHIFLIPAQVATGEQTQTLAASSWGRDAGVGFAPYSQCGCGIEIDLSKLGQEVTLLTYNRHVTI